MKNAHGKIEINSSIEIVSSFQNSNIISSFRCLSSDAVTPDTGKNIGGDKGADAIDQPTVKPVIDVTLVAGRPRIDWEKQGMDGIEIHATRTPADPFTFLAIDTIPDYDDTAPLPEPGQSAVWKYKAIYRLGEGRMGQWSDEVSIVVMG